MNSRVLRRRVAEATSAHDAGDTSRAAELAAIARDEALEAIAHSASLYRARELARVALCLRTHGL